MREQSSDARVDEFYQSSFLEEERKLREMSSFWNVSAPEPPPEIRRSGAVVSPPRERRRTTRSWIRIGRRKGHYFGATSAAGAKDVGWNIVTFSSSENVHRTARARRAALRGPTQHTRHSAVRVPSGSGVWVTSGFPNLNHRMRMPRVSSHPMHRILHLLS